MRTDDDRTVTPTDSAELEGALNIEVQELCPASTTTHGGLPGDPVVLATLGSGAGRRARRRRPTGRHLLMSLVAKFAQAAPANTTR